MNREEIVELLKEIAGPNIELFHHPKWVGFRCLLAPWTHEHGADKTPSAGVSVKDGDTSIFNCYVCGKGPVSYLLKELEKYTGENYAHLIRHLETGEFLGGALPDWGKGVKRVAETFLDKEQYLDLYDNAENHWYFEDRAKARGEEKITNRTIRTLQIQLDPSDSQGDERILFPVFNRDGELHGFTGRAVHEQVVPKVRDYHGLPKERVLLGCNLVRKDDHYVVAVEGLFDVAMLVQYDQPVVGTLHSGLTIPQAQILLDIGLPVVLMFDNDAAGEKATEVAIEMLSGRLPLTRVKYPRRLQGKGKKPKCPKDPALCTEAEVIEMIANAKIV